MKGENNFGGAPFEVWTVDVSVIGDAGVGGGKLCIL